MLRSTLLFVLAALLLAACQSGARPRGPVNPEPPGPIDALRSVWGDYSGRCPDDYTYCKGDGGQPICCPLTARCCYDASGPYCCSADGRAGRSLDPYPPQSGDDRYDRYDRDRRYDGYDDDRSPY